MTNILKKYQSKSIEDLVNYITKIHSLDKDGDPKDTAFYVVTKTKYNNHNIDAPSICIKIPTGGGKTLVACESIKTIHREYLSRIDDVGLVLWLVPTDAILYQTIKKLCNFGDIYYATLNESFSDIKVFSIEEALSIKRSDIKNNLCIIVATFAVFRTEDTPKKMSKKNVFKENGSLMDHFQGLTSTVTPSLHEVIKLYHPIVILDESHHTKTHLSYEMIQNFNPSFVIEFTATPRNELGKESNVLVNVNAVELKNEGMVKLPIIHTNEPDWERVIDLGIQKRHFLERECNKLKKITGEYIRPIILFQAEQNKESEKVIDTNQVKNYLLKNHKIPEEQIAIKTSKDDDLKGKNLNSKSSPIRYIITVRALAEGWDNPFAYVLVSIMNTKSRTAGEQIIGRILRMPKQKRKPIDALNCAYVFTSSINMDQIVKELESELERNGYDKKDMIPSKKKKDVTQTRQVIDDNDIKLPCITITEPIKHMLEYEDLLPDMLPNPDIINIGQLTSISEVREIDVTESGIKSTVQKTLFPDDSDSYTKDKLMTKLRREVRRARYSSKDMTKYINDIVDRYIQNDITKSEKEKIKELSKNIRIVIEKINNSINMYEQDESKKKFMQHLEKGNLVCMYRSLSNDMPLTNPQENTFTKHLFNNLERMNKEEEDFATKIDSLDTVKWWYRNPVKNENAFYVMGWKPNLIYPDFIIKTNNDHYYIIEYKGEHLKGNEKTVYKQKMLDILSTLAGENYKTKIIFKEEINELIDEINNSVVSSD